MVVPEIVKYPDLRLRERALDVVLDDPLIAEQAAGLILALRAADAVGITGPHIGVRKRIVALALPDMPVPRIYLNPRIVWSSKNTVTHDEGSVSMPGIVDKLTRAAAVRVQYETLSGATEEEMAEGFHAICHQHEIDQLDGIFWIERLSPLKRERALARYRKFQRG